MRSLCWGPLFLPHGDVLGIVVPREAECIHLSFEFEGDGRDDGVVGVGEEFTIAEEGDNLVAEEVMDIAPDSCSDKSLMEDSQDIG